MTTTRANAFAAAICVAATFILPGCNEPAAKPEPIRPVRAVRVGDVSAVHGRAFSGRAAATKEVDLSFQVSGPLNTLSVDVGSEVKAGDVIATIDPRDFQAALDRDRGNLARAKANLTAMMAGARPEEIERLKADVAEAEANHAEAVASFERQKTLLAQEATTEQKYDIAVARRDRSAAELKSTQEALNIGLAGARPEDLEAKRSEIRALEAAVASSQNQLDYAVLKAPFDGEVAARYVDNFQTVQAQQPIVRLLDVSSIEVTVQIPESIVSLVPLVKQVSCRFDALPDREFTGHITKIGSEASQTTRTYPVTVEIEQPEDVRILPGMAATVRNKPDESDAEPQQGLIIPPAAVFADEEQQSYVWVIDEDAQTVTQRPVETGELTPVGLAVTDGLQRGERVVTAGVNSLREGQQVRIMEE